ncbi:MAG: CYTH domain-containing protein [Gracilimonas sp.]|uniref:CYTH domain-containing protein n=1 Tax=Gracilimonas sp. TaxID=1974203 RepID=UPI003750FB5A|nr:CYTH domain-containing protein [Gracilimonas sp.]
MKSIEIESKLELNSEDFDKLKSSGRIKCFKDQLNIYFDSNNSLSERGITFRIRLIPGSFPVLTLKIPRSISEESRNCIEIEKELRTDFKLSKTKKINIKKELPNEFSELLENLNIELLERIGYMRTHRWVAELPNGIDVELDEVRLPTGQKFFEVEIENDVLDQRESAINIIRQITGFSQPSLQSKYERFREALEILNNEKKSSFR